MASLRARQIFRDSSRTLLAVESVDYWHVESQSACQAFGSVTLVAVVLCGPEETRALDAQARPADLRRLRRGVPGLDALLPRSTNAG